MLEVTVLSEVVLSTRKCSLKWLKRIKVSLIRDCDSEIHSYTLVPKGNLSHYC